jgi:hypothetical protein
VPSITELTVVSKPPRDESAQPYSMIKNWFDGGDGL